MYKITKKTIDSMNAYSNLKMNSKNETKVEKAYYSFISFIYRLLLDEKNFSMDIFEMAFENYFEINGYKKVNKEKDVKDLLEHIKCLLSLNKWTHYLLIPLQLSTLKDNLYLNDEICIISKKDVEKMYEDISDYTHIELFKVKDSLIHTQHSRQPDFMKDNILIYKIEDQTDNVTYSSIEISRYILNSMHIVHQSFDVEENLLLGYMSLMTNECNHVAILSSDNWRCGHGYSNDFSCVVRYDMTFLKNEEIFKNFIDLKNILVKKHKTKFEYQISSTISLFGQAEYQREVSGNNTIAFVLYFVALESLLCEGYKSKKQCLSRVIPVLINSKDGEKLSKKIADLYEKRNYFIHRGTPLIYYEENENLCDFLSIITAKVIFEAFKTNTGNTDDFITWSKKIANIYSKTKDSWIVRFINKYFHKRKTL